MSGVFDALRGGSKELGRKIGSAAKDIKTAGQRSSLQADLNKLTQRAGQTIQMLTRQFEDLQGRAQVLGLDNELQQIKIELNALDNYMRTAAGNGSMNQQTEPIPLIQKKQNIPSSPKNIPEPVQFGPSKKKDKGLTRDNVKQALSQTGNNARKAASLLTNQLGKIITDQDVVNFLMKESFLRKK